MSEPGRSRAPLTDDLRVVCPVQDLGLEAGIVVTHRVLLSHHTDRPQLLVSTGLASPHLNQRLVECIIGEPENKPSVDSG